MLEKRLSTTKLTKQSLFSNCILLVISKKILCAFHNNVSVLPVIVLSMGSKNLHSSLDGEFFELTKKVSGTSFF